MSVGAIVAIIVLVLSALVLCIALRARIAGSGSADTAASRPATPIVTTQTLRYTTRSLRRQEVNLQILPVPLPAEASDIQFAQYSEWQAFEMFVVFHGPRQTCVEYARAILTDFSKRYRDRRVSPDLVPVDAAVPGESTPRPSEIPIPWFKPQSIRNGMTGGTRDSHCPRVWVDTDRGIFYYEMTD